MKQLILIKNKHLNGVLVSVAFDVLRICAHHWVSMMLLVGILMMYTTVYCVLLPPTTARCALTRFTYGTAYTVCYASIVVKINRIVRIFNMMPSNNDGSGKLCLSWFRCTTPNVRARPARVKHVDPLSQLTLICTVVLFQVQESLCTKLKYSAFLTPFGSYCVRRRPTICQ
jgi:hypothetical protein